MSDPAAPTWYPLAPDQRRVLGALIEKQKTSKSADAYPMSLNAITTACNQKSNRDPVTDYDEDQVEATLANLQRSGLVMKMTGSRVDRWRHLLYEAWGTPSKVEMAVLAELLLRGPQTEGDLRGRASRMDEIKDLDELRGLLKNLASRNLVVYLTPPGRGAVVTHGFHTLDELEKARAAGGAMASASEAATRPASSGLEARLNEAFDEIAKLRETVARLEARIAELGR
jgi:uncharacterized protein YceH (UPF0502 family)